MKRTVKLLVLAIVLVCVLAPVLSACNKGSGTRGGDTLVIYNWEDYIDSSKNEDGKTILDEFADYYKSVTGRNLSVTYTTFDTNETMMTKVLKGDANVDLICPSEYAIEKLTLAGLLVNQKELMQTLQTQYPDYNLTFENIDNVEPAVMEVIKDMFGAIEGGGKTYDMTEYMVPYMWGTLGLLYNTNIISEEELEQYGWGLLWNMGGNEKLENMILMKDSVRDSYAAAVFYLLQYDMLPDGVSPTYGKKFSDLSIQELINCTDSELLAAAERALTEQRQHISGYEVDFGKDDMINEIVYLDLAWSGDALWAIEESDYYEETETYQLGYYVPECGSNIWYDGWVIPTSVKNSLAAMMFIDYMCAPMSGVRNSMEIGYTSAVAKEVLEADEDVCAFIEECEYDLEEYFGDIGRYPEINDKLGVMRDYGSMNETVMNMWQRAKAGKEVPMELIYCLIAVVAVGLLIGGGYFIKEALKLRPRKIKDNQ